MRCSCQAKSGRSRLPARRRRKGDTIFVQRTLRADCGIRLMEDLCDSHLGEGTVDSRGWEEQKGNTTGSFFQQFSCEERQSRKSRVNQRFTKGMTKGREVSDSVVLKSPNNTTVSMFLLFSNHIGKLLCLFSSFKVWLDFFQKLWLLIIWF